MESVKSLVGIIVQGSMILMILGVAMQSKWSDIGQFVRQPVLVLKGVLAINVIVPLVATIVALALPLPLHVEVALILMAISPLAPLVPTKAIKEGGQRSYVFGLYTVLIILAIVIVPISIKLLDGLFETEALGSVALVGKIILISAVLPILAGLILSSAFPTFAMRAAPICITVANIILIVFVVLLLPVIGKQLLALIGNGTVLAFGFVTAVGIVAGHLLGGPDWNHRTALAIASAIRHPGIAASVAHANGTDPRVLSGIILFLLNGVIVTALYHLWLKRQTPRALNPG